MSAAPASGAAPANKAVATDKSADPAKDSKPTAALEEDDEFEDFPVESRSIDFLDSRMGGAAVVVVRQTTQRPTRRR